MPAKAFTMIQLPTTAPVATAVMAGTVSTVTSPLPVLAGVVMLPPTSTPPALFMMVAILPAAAISMSTISVVATRKKKHTEGRD